MGQTTIIEGLDDRSPDYRYAKEQGWFASGYFYPTRLGLLKKVAGKIFDRMAPTIQKRIA